VSEATHRTASKTELHRNGLGRRSCFALQQKSQ